MKGAGKVPTNGGSAGSSNSSVVGREVEAAAAVSFEGEEPPPTRPEAIGDEVPFASSPRGEDDGDDRNGEAAREEELPPISAAATAPLLSAIARRSARLRSRRALSTRRLASSCRCRRRSRCADNCALHSANACEHSRSTSLSATNAVRRFSDGLVGRSDTNGGSPLSFPSVTAAPAFPLLGGDSSVEPRPAGWEERKPKGTVEGDRLRGAVRCGDETRPLSFADGGDIVRLDLRPPPPTSAGLRRVGRCCVFTLVLGSAARLLLPKTAPSEDMTRLQMF